jgi:hypothetical protein
MPMRIYSEEKCGSSCSHVYLIYMRSTLRTYTLENLTSLQVTQSFLSVTKRFGASVDAMQVRSFVCNSTQTIFPFPKKCQFSTYSRYFLTSTQISSAIVENEGSLSRSLFKLAQTASMGAPAAVTPQTENVRSLTMHALDTRQCYLTRCRRVARCA